MPWHGNYYYRSKRINGQPRRIYMGTGTDAVAAAEEDRKARDARDIQQMNAKRLVTEHAELDVNLAEVHRLADILSRAALYAAGYHQHCKGDWRPKRDFPRV